MKKCKNCVYYKTRGCPKTMWVGRILLGDNKLKNNTPCEKYEYMPLLQRAERMYNKYKEKVMMKVKLAKTKRQLEQLKKEETNPTPDIGWDKEMLKRVYNNVLTKHGKDN